MIRGYDNPMDSVNVNSLCDEKFFIAHDDATMKTVSSPGPCNVSAENRELISNILGSVDAIERLLFGINNDCRGDQMEPPMDCLLSDLKYQHDQLEHLSKKLYAIRDRITQ